MKEKCLQYRVIIAKLQGAIMGIVINLKLPNPDIKAEIRRLEKAIKNSDESIETLTQNKTHESRNKTNSVV